MHTPAVRSGWPWAKMAEERRLVMGIDGGGSKTLALLADENGQVIGRGLAGPSNFQVEGIQAARQTLQDALREAFRSTGKPVQRLAALCLGIAGVSRPDDRKWLAIGWQMNAYQTG